MVRKVLRTPAVLAATGWSKATLYAKISAGIFPPATHIDPNGRVKTSQAGQKYMSLSVRPKQAEV